MTSGNVLKSIIKFAIPCILTRIIQNLYPLIDSIIAGKLLSVDGLSAVGVAGSIYSLFNETVVGLVSGFAVVLGKKIGAGEKKQVSITNSHALLISVFCSVIISVIGIIFSEELLLILKTPANITAYGEKYLLVLFSGFLPNALYNYYCETMRASGNSRKPLYLLITSTILHFIFIIPLTDMFGIYGVALATVIPYIITIFAATVMIRKDFPQLKFVFPKFEKIIFRECFHIGLPMALTNLIVIAGVLVLNLVTNMIGDDYIAAYSCASKIGYIITTPIFGFATTLAVFTSQNYGAKNYDKIKEGISKTLKLTLIINVVLLIVTMLTCEALLTFILSGNKTAVNAGITYLSVRCLAMFILTPAAFYKNILPSIGKPFFPTISGFMEIAVRYLFPLLSADSLGFISVPLTDAVSWTMLALMLTIAFKYEFKKLILK